MQVGVVFITDQVVYPRLGGDRQGRGEELPCGVCECVYARVCVYVSVCTHASVCM